MFLGKPGDALVKHFGTKRYRKPTFDPWTLIVGALESLKLTLGMMGRGDFVTSFPPFHAQLYWIEEQIAVYVLPCTWHDCPEHRIDKQSFPFAWKEAQRSARATVTQDSSNLVHLGFITLKFFDCEVVASPERAAMTVLASLAASKPVDRIVSHSAKRQRLRAVAIRATTDAMLSQSREQWAQFIGFLAVAPATIWKADLIEAMCESGWERENVRQLWRVCAYHRIITYTGAGFRKGPGLKAVCDLLGIYYNPTRKLPRKERDVEVSGQAKSDSE